MIGFLRLRPFELPMEQAGDAAVVFDPRNTAETADAVRRLWTDERLRRELVEKGRADVSRFSWERTARMFRAPCRRICGRTLSEEDRRLLNEPPLL